MFIKLTFKTIFNIIIRYVCETLSF